MIRLVVANQKGGVAKTTTCLNMARCFADKGIRVLLIDTDSQGSIRTALGVKCENFLYEFVISNYRLADCVTQVYPNIDVICSDRRTIEAEGILMPRPGRELQFKVLLAPAEEAYEVVLIDAAPSITLFQSCSYVYAQQILIPLTMDPLSLQGAFASIEAARTLNSLFKTDIRPVAILPVMVDRRLQITDMILKSLEGVAAGYQIPILQAIRTDAAITKAHRMKMFLADYDAKSKGAEDYTVAAEQLLAHLKGQSDGRQRQLQTPA